LGDFVTASCGARKERRRIRIIIMIRRNGAKTISPPNFVLEN
jgi:hypothetical protein